MTVDSEDYRPEGPGDPLPRDMPDQQADRQEADEDDGDEASPEPPDVEESPEPGESPG
ncbi:hypothetical protein [Streptomyces sp. NPDC005805]|uniref:hypothetical protein n=1 Tax=Streptomyces sp. NPDC005805 TaxID=3157068 RepID=UPI0033FC9901